MKLTYLLLKQLVNANVEIVMCAYNRLNDEPCCGSSTLLNNLLRKNWGFKGSCSFGLWCYL